MKRNPTFILFSVFLALGLLMIGGALFVCNSVRTFDANATKTTGTVLELVASTSKNSQGSSTTYAPLVSYTDNSGGTHQYKPNYSSNPPGYEVGEKVDVFYDPKNPDDVKLGGLGEYTGAFVLGGIGLVFALIGLIAVLVILRKRARTAQLKETGELVQAQFDMVKQNIFVEINRIHPFHIHCSWKDPLTGTLHSFKSGMLLMDPSPYMAAHKTLDVYMDRNNPKKYFVDTSFLPS